jgi:hypothetical protein
LKSKLLIHALANGSKEHLFLDDGGAVGLTKNAIEAEIYEITHKAEYMDDTKNKLLVERVTSLYSSLRHKRFCYIRHFTSPLS